MKRENNDNMDLRIEQQAKGTRIITGEAARELKKTARS